MSVSEHLSALQYYSKEELAYRELRAAILAGVLKAGERLLPQELARRLKVSTMPVRQALTRLELEGLVQRVPNWGLTVAPLSVKEVEEIYTLRAVLEGLAARLAAPRLSDQDLASLAALVNEMEAMVSSEQTEALAETNAKFHFAIYKAANNERLYALLRNLWDVSSRYRHIYYGEPGVPEQTLREHRGTLAALQQRDAAKAEEQVRSDMEETARVLVALIKAAIEQNREGDDGKLPVG